MGMFLFSKAATWITGQIFVSPKLFHTGRSFPCAVGVYVEDWTAGQVHGYWHRTSDGTGAKIGAVHMRAKCRNRQPSYGLLRSTTRSPARPSSVYRTVSSQPRLRSISSWSSGWLFGSAAAVALILLARLSVPFLLLLPTQVVDGGEHHVRLPALAYPESVLDPAKVKSLIAARL
jgi:hypothetical protein